MEPGHVSSRLVLQFVLVVVVAVPAVVALIKLRSVADEWTDEAVDRVSKRPDVARRSPHYRALWKTGVMCCLLALMPVVIGLKGDMGRTSNTTGSQWLVLALVSVGLLVIGGVLLSLWWILAGRQATSAAES